MDAKSNITQRAELSLSENQLKCDGSYVLIDRIQKYKQQHGVDPINWPIKLCTPESALDNYDILINEFILKVRNEYKITYTHEEMCHCRTVPTETVVQSIKQGCRSLKDIGRATKAGTGCGTCIPNLKVLLSEILK